MRLPTAPDSRQSIPKRRATPPHETNSAPSTVSLCFKRHSQERDSQEANALDTNATTQTQTTHPQMLPSLSNPRSVLSPLRAK